MDTITVALADRAYPIHVGRGLLTRLGEWAGPPARAALLCDDGVPFSLVERAARSLEYAGLSLARVTVRAGEDQKCLSVAERILDELVDAGLERGSTLFVIGGGMATDLGGFCAAVLMRGVPLVLLPTTLLAQLDAAVGGKTGVNLAAGKNLCGAFWQPRVVACDLDALGTLPVREVRSGLAEAVKCGLVGDPALLDRLEADPPAAQAGSPAVIEEIIGRALRVKADLVARDEREEAGERVRLNLGHTVGHALEAASQYDLRHGEAISLGLVAALRIGVHLRLTPPELEARVTRLLASLGLPVDLEPYLAGPWLSPAAFDKKRRSSRLRFVCVSAPGETRVVEMDPRDLPRNLHS